MGEDGLHGEGILRGGDAPQAATTVGSVLSGDRRSQGMASVNHFPEPFAPLTRLQAKAQRCATVRTVRPARLLALLDRSDLETTLRPPRTFYPSFHSRRSPSP
jgi:hypothetical protein